jgi:hypothetical protein
VRTLGLCHETALDVDILLDHLKRDIPGMLDLWSDKRDFWRESAIAPLASVIGRA